MDFQVFNHQKVQMDIQSAMKNMPTHHQKQYKQIFLSTTHLNNIFSSSLFQGPLDPYYWTQKDLVIW